MTNHGLANWLRENLTNLKRYQEQGVNEANTESWVIRPLLIQLGWGVNQPDHIVSQYPVGSEKIDLVLLDHEGRPVVLIEEKQISLDLDEGTERGTLDLEKYKRQLTESPCDLLVVTNGMKTWFLVRVESDSGKVVCRCESATVDFSELEPEDTTGINEATKKLELLNRDELLSGRSLERLQKSAELELAVESVGKVLMTSPAVVEVIAREANVAPDLVHRAMEVVIGEDSDGGQISIEPLTPEQMEGAPPSPKEIKLRRKMVDSTRVATDFRHTAFKFRKIWKLFETKDVVPKYVIHDLVAQTVVTKARGQFYSSYCHRSPLLVRIDHNGTQESEDCYKINDYVRPHFSKMLQLMDEENGHG